MFVKNANALWRPTNSYNWISVIRYTYNVPILVRYIVVKTIFLNTCNSQYLSIPTYLNFNWQCICNNIHTAPTYYWY